MATLALSAVGAVVGSAVLPAGVSVLGATLTGAAIGSQVGALAGSYIDQALLGGSAQSRNVQGPRLSDLQVTSSTEGLPIPRLYGRARLGGQIIWATDFEEEVVRTSQSSGGGKGGGGASRSTSTRTDYRYYANFAVALCEGEISRIGRVWADGRELELPRVTWRLYTGRQDQVPDSMIVAREGADRAPAYRGVAYIAFERLPLAQYGNRIPQLSFEVFRAVGERKAKTRAVALIPGSGEFVYATEPVERRIAAGHTQAENVHTLIGETDWQVSLDQMQMELPDVSAVSLIVSWFGTDLRVGHCQLRPSVERRNKNTSPLTWSVSGDNRNSAFRVSERDGRAAYGGTPSDDTVVNAIIDLKERGIDVMLTPFILMDVPEGNTLPSPFGGIGQPTYPWRGRITCSPAAGQPSTADKTAEATDQVADFVGTVSVDDFSISGNSVIYSGPSEWSYRRFMLHHAFLAKAAGGVSAFQIGSEMRDLSQVRGLNNTYPFVEALVTLAADVKSVLGPDTDVLYGADWSEYFGHQPADGSGDVFFHLDPLWASDDISAIGIDVYWPLSDWRDGVNHVDAAAGVSSIYDPMYLTGNVQGGEGYDWYYASAQDRDAQVRTPITDGAGKPWIYRYKDIWSWWENPHYNRPGGVESLTPTAWVPQSKAFWFTEIGCPAVDKGANQPNVFVDPKSSETALPYYSGGVRDDLMQARLLDAMQGAFDWTSDLYIDGANPVSSITGERMVATHRIFAYCWDARPFPAFPFETEIWGDGDNWPTGHWINGRLGSTEVPALLAEILTDYGFTRFAASDVEGIVPGYVIDRIMSPRDAIQPLELAYFFDPVESGGLIQFRQRRATATHVTIDVDGVVETRPDSPLYALTRAQETELPASAKVRYISPEDGYQQAVVEARRLIGKSGRVAQASLPIVLDATQAQPIAESWLFETWAARERASFSLPPSMLAIEPSDVVHVTFGGIDRLLRVTDIGDHGAREIGARGFDGAVYGKTVSAGREQTPATPVQIGSPAVLMLDIPDWTESGRDDAGYIAATQIPWPGGIAAYASPQETGYQIKAAIGVSATRGEIENTVLPGPEGRFDRANVIRVKLTDGALRGEDTLSVLSGVNVATIQNETGDWELIQFENAVLVGENTYELSGLLRGQAGTEGAMAEINPGAVFVLLDGSTTPVTLRESEVGLPLNWQIGPGNRSLGDDSFVKIQHAFERASLRPFSPVHIRGQRTGAGDLQMTWIRRTRIGGDRWEIDEVPLGEDAEHYEVDILNGETVVRTIASDQTAAVYTSSAQIEDFGQIQSHLTVDVFQRNAVFGRGSGRRTTI